MSEIQLNARWRVVLSDFDPPQWLLQRSHQSGWATQSWCQTRAALLTAIDEKIVRADRVYQGGHAMAVEQSALDAVSRLPASSYSAFRGSEATHVPPTTVSSPSGAAVPEITTAATMVQP